MAAACPVLGDPGRLGLPVPPDRLCRARILRVGLTCWSALGVRAQPRRRARGVQPAWHSRRSAVRRCGSRSASVRTTRTIRAGRGADVDAHSKPAEYLYWHPAIKGGPVSLKLSDRLVLSPNIARYMGRRRDAGWSARLSTLGHADDREINFSAADINRMRSYEYGSAGAAQLDVRISQPDNPDTSFWLIEVKAPAEWGGADDPRIRGQLFCAHGRRHHGPPHRRSFTAPTTGYARSTATNAATGTVPRSHRPRPLDGSSDSPTWRACRTSLRCIRSRSERRRLWSLRPHCSFGQGIYSRVRSPHRNPHCQRDDPRRRAQWWWSLCIRSEWSDPFAARWLHCLLTRVEVDRRSLGWLGTSCLSFLCPLGVRLL